MVYAMRMHCATMGMYAMGVHCATMGMGMHSINHRDNHECIVIGTYVCMNSLATLLIASAFSLTSFLASSSAVFSKLFKMMSSR